MSMEDAELVSALLVWFGSIGDLNFHREMAVVVAIKLCKGFVVMPVESTEPSPTLCLEVTTRISRADPATLHAIRNLRGALTLAPPKAELGIRQLAQAALRKAQEAAFFESVFLPSQALKSSGDFTQAVTRLNGIEYHQIGLVEKAMPEPHRRLLAKAGTGSENKNFEAIETVAGMALTMVDSILIEQSPEE